MARPPKITTFINAFFSAIAVFILCGCSNNLRPQSSDTRTTSTSIIETNDDITKKEKDEKSKVKTESITEKTNDIRVFKLRALNNVVGFFNIASTTNDATMQNLSVGRGFDPARDYPKEGVSWWRELFATYVEPLLKPGLRRIQFHNPFGRIPGNIMQFGMYQVAQSHAPGLVYGFVESFSWLLSTYPDLEEVIFYFGGPHNSVEATRQDDWQYLMTEITPYMELINKFPGRISIGLDNTAPRSNETSGTWLLAKYLMDKGVKVYVEAKPTLDSVWMTKLNGNVNTVILDTTMDTQTHTRRPTIFPQDASLIGDFNILMRYEQPTDVISRSKLRLSQGYYVMIYDLMLLKILDTSLGVTPSESAFNNFIKTISPDTLTLRINLSPNLTADSSTTKIEIISNPKHGRLEINPLNAFQLNYSPTHDYTGEDSFSYCYVTNSKKSEPKLVSVVIE
jgi:hypothetical protein